MFKKTLLLPVILLNACMTVGPNYKDPSIKVSKNWLYTSKRNDASVKLTKKKYSNWWKMFHDPALNKLIEKGYKDNLNLQISGVRVLLARANLGLSIGEQFPQSQALGGNYEYKYLGGSSLSSLLPSSFHSASLGFGASWEIDFWGKYRRAIESSDANFLSSMTAYDNTLVTLLSDIASTYINIRTNEEQINVTRQNINAQKASLDIVIAKYTSGQTSQLDVEQAKTQLGQTQAQLPSKIASVQIQKDKLAVLLGIVPNQINDYLKQSKTIPTPPKQVEISIPKEVLAQRPDVAQSRLQAIASSAQIGATKAQLFPAFSLAGNFNFSATDIGTSSLSNLFQWSSRSINAGPSFYFPIFNYGRIVNSIRIKDALFQEALLSYENTVLKAQQEVQDTITQYIQLKNTLSILRRTNQSALQATHLAMVRYKNGETSYTSVLDALREQLQVQSSFTQAKGDINLALTGLFRSLGGGWQLRIGHDVLSSEIKEQMAKRTNWGNLLEPDQHLPLEIKKGAAKKAPMYPLNNKK